MQPKWFKEEICEELEGACTYLKCAIDTMKTYPEWSKQFYEMADQEQEHATHLYKMFMSMYTDSEPNGYMKDLMEGVMNCFSTYMRKIEDHKITYEMMSKQETKKTANVLSSYTPASSIVQG